MQRFFVTPGQVGEQEIYIEGSDVNHMKNVLRLKTGEEVMVSDGDNRQYRCAVKEYLPGELSLRSWKPGMWIQSFRRRSIFFRDCQSRTRWN